MDTSENPKIMKMMVLGFPQSEIEKLLVQNEGQSFLQVYNKNGHPDPQTPNPEVFPAFQDFL